MPGQHYVGMSVTPEARESLRRLVLTVSAQVGRRVEMSEALSAACEMSRANLTQFVAIIEGEDQ